MEDRFFDHVCRVDDGTRTDTSRSTFDVADEAPIPFFGDEVPYISLAHGGIFGGGSLDPASDDNRICHSTDNWQDNGSVAVRTGVIASRAHHGFYHYWLEEY